MSPTLTPARPVPALASLPRSRRISAGNYRVTAGGHVYDVQKTRSDYGDTQWVIDRDGVPWSTADTLRQARRYVAGYDHESQKGQS